MPDLITPGDEFASDDGSAEPRLEAVLSGYAAGRESEHAMLTALAHARLLVPVVAAVTEVENAPAGAGPACAGPGGRSPGREKTSEMALPVLVGHDGRRAILAFTSVAALARWHPEARPLPAIADRVWQAAIGEQIPAVVVDVAGPVPVAVEGARLAALAAGQPVPPPHDDPDVRAVADAVAAADPDIEAVTIAPGSDLTVRLTVGVPPDDAAAVAERAAHTIMSALAGRFRRGIEIAVVPAVPRRAKHGC